MQASLIYIGKTAVVLALFYMFYRLLLSKEKMHRINRLVLLLTSAASFVLPLCVVTIHKAMPEAATVEASAEVGPMVMSLAAGSAKWWVTVLAVIYFAGAAFMLSRLLAAVIGTGRVIRAAEFVREEDGIRIYVSDSDGTPFSWMRSIVLPREDYESSNPDILLHEKAHIKLRHSWDLLLVDAFKAAQWFNPAMWMLRSDLAEIHEYQADDAVLRTGADIKNYQYLLVRKSVGTAGYTIVNSFNHSTLKNRITMMQKKNSTARVAFKALYVLPLVCFCLAANAKTVYVSAQQDLTIKSPDGKQSLYIVDGKKMPYDKVKEIDKSTISSVEVLQAASAMTLYGEDGKNGAVVIVTKDYEKEITTTETESGKMDEVVVVGYGTLKKDEVQVPQNLAPAPFGEVEVKPMFNGGDAVEFSKYVAQHMIYPENCKKSGAQGRVMLSFTISTEGNLADIEVLRSSGNAELDAEAVRVVSSSPAWTPAQNGGKTVPVRFTFPVIFALR